MPFTPSLDALDFQDDLESTVAIEYNAGAVGKRWDPKQNYQAVAGLGAVPCHVVALRTSQTTPQGVHLTDPRHAGGMWRVMFLQPIDIDKRHRMVWVDPDTGETRYLYVTDKSRNSEQLGVWWVADCVEYTE